MASLSSLEIKKTAEEYRGLAQYIFLYSLPKAEAIILDAISNGASPNEIMTFQKDRDKVKTKFNEYIDEAIRLDVSSLAVVSQATDISSALAVINCSTGKAKLAIKQIEDTKVVLEILTKFLELGAAIVAATTTGNIANIAEIVEGVDQLVRYRFESILDPEELDALSDELKDCLP